MHKNIEEISESITMMLEKLENIETEITSQREDVATYFRTHGTRTDSDERLIARMQALATGVELLRDEVDELHELMIVLFKESDNE